MNKSAKLTIVTACAIVGMIMGATIGHIPSVVFASGGNSSSGGAAINSTTGNATSTNSTGSGGTAINSTTGNATK